uniref:3-beta hydroxysteroid dehydrogenase/isomerase domain-containing protein n=1 Tax=Taeniopygia guttata TaxID=59729 RepID=A0A674H6U6_TAEGU
MFWGYFGDIFGAISGYFGDILGIFLGWSQVIFGVISGGFGCFSRHQERDPGLPGTKNVIRACRAAGVPVLIYTSSMEVVGPNTRGDPFVRGDEETPYPTRHSEPYPLSKAQAEKRCLNGPPGHYKFPHKIPEFHSNFTQISPKKSPKIPHKILKVTKNPQIFPKTPKFPPNSAGNVAWMHLLAARAARARPASVGGEFFFCYDASPWAPYEEFNLLLLGPAGISGGPRVPPKLSALLAWFNGVLRAVLGRFGVFFAPLLNPYTWAVASTPFSVRTAKAERELGYRPLFSWEEARERTAGWLRQLDGA